MSRTGLVFNPPPGWPKPPPDWVPPAGWTPEPSWPDPPPGWQLWVPADNPEHDEAAPADVDSTLTGVDQTADDAADEFAEDLADERLKARIAAHEAELAAARTQAVANDDHDDYVVLDDDRVLQSVGIYRYHHPLESASAYRDRLDNLNSRIAECVKSGIAIEASSMFTYDNSLAKGRRMTADLSKLMLRAYNAEADNVLRTLRPGNVVTARKRLEATRSSIAKLGRMMEMHISDEFHVLRIEEIELTADWLMKRQEEKEAEREERARLREEKRVQRELAAERERLEKERSHIVNALQALKSDGNDDPSLDAKLAEIDAAIADNDYRIANIRAGYVYVISNRGAFGPGVVKIGLTRRLEPLDRVSELSGAAVPFRFDVHALFFSEDAVTLENELHKQLASRALNLMNPRKEFFFATPAEVRDILAAKVGNLLEFTEHADSTEYFQSVNGWPDEVKGPATRPPDSGTTRNESDPNGSP